MEKILASIGGGSGIGLSRLEKRAARFKKAGIISYSFKNSKDLEKSGIEPGVILFTSLLAIHDHMKETIDQLRGLFPKAKILATSVSVPYMVEFKEIGGDAYFHRDDFIEPVRTVSRFFEQGS